MYGPVFAAIGWDSDFNRNDRYLASLAARCRDRRWAIVIYLYDAEISCVVYVDVGDSVPAIHFDRDIIQKIAELNAEIDVDLYYIEFSRVSTA